MRKKTIRLFLTLVILLVFTGSAYAGLGWGIRTDDFGPIVVSAPAHPWGENTHRSNNYPPSYRGGAGCGSVGFFPAPTFTDFVVEFFFRYVVKQQMSGQDPVWKYTGSE
jgi:hypothetical protein